MTVCAGRQVADQWVRAGRSRRGCGDVRGLDRDRGEPARPECRHGRLGRRSLVRVRQPCRGSLSGQPD